MQSIGQRASSAHFVLLVAARSPAPANASGCARLGVVATKKVGNAAQRNRIKRVCRECFRAWPELVPDGIDLVVIARPGAHELDLASVRGEWEQARPVMLRRCEAALRPSSEQTSAAARSASAARLGPK